MVSGGFGLTSFWQIVHGRSMSPALVEGDEVLLSPLVDGPEPGEVVVMRLGPGTMVLHRVVASRDGVVETRGDACPRSDRRSPTRAVLLRATMRRRRGLVRPIPPLGLPARLLRSGLARRLVRLIAAPGRWWRVRWSSSTSRAAASSA